MRKLLSKKFIIAIFLLIFVTGIAQEPVPIPEINIDIGGGTPGPDTLIPTLEILLLLSILTLAPSLIMMFTSFMRIVIVLSFLRTAMGSRQAPPNQVLIGISLILTFLIMTPVFNDIYQNAVIPYTEEKISYTEFFEKTWEPVKKFMINEIVAHHNQDNIFMLASSVNKKVENINDTPPEILIPAFTLSELEISFKMGVLIYIPFIIVDMVVASILLSMGMMMIPPIMISMPFKLLLFILVNGWDLLIGGLIRSFQTSGGL
ncbi:flagellar biosynthesis protein flip [Marinitoga sp. 1135]|uniref:Flagellar biosynthetic protein FliP n=1 Tax=Marinitoga piezophila (strain DSM 14283 / JCM 11233 / KA3) TaxID=443254 RepID=H2J6G8_MARPK|nr:MULTISPECIES: flagellar type III secretion system pore protein FliP [Marinitoga]AEX85153.1 flagellar biosynthetic protein FliP [Marinitoga piezophila KA3]APT75652.1 flagellar biosynthesis protein flip [Marinitoga sp. 1137]NUU95392.1 flagellar biosynthesis protein flip [Marinitoga sp. 1135]NUU97320.1 flagellar biosynthesis protein flip [Marinitoga sp. 1138]